MPQTREDRIRLEYRAHRRSSWVHEHGVGRFWLGLARKWKLSVQDIKRICKGECGAEPAEQVLHVMRSVGVKDPHCNRYRGHHDEHYVFWRKGGFRWPAKRRQA